MKIPIGHTSNIKSVVFSQDGKWLFTGGDDNTVVIWDVQTGLEIRRIKTTQPVQKILIPADKSSILTVSGQDAGGLMGKLDLSKWNIYTGKELNRLSFSGSTHLGVLISGDILIAENSAAMQSIIKNGLSPNSIDPDSYTKKNLTGNDSLYKAYTKRMQEVIDEMNRDDISKKVDPSDKKAVDELIKKRSKELSKKLAELQNEFFPSPYQKTINIYNSTTFQKTAVLSKGFDEVYNISYQKKDFIIVPKTNIAPEAGESRYSYQAWELNNLINGKSFPLSPTPWKTYPVNQRANTLYTSQEKGFFAIPVEKNSFIQLWQLEKPEPIFQFKVSGKTFSGAEFSPNGNLLYIYSYNYDSKERDYFIEGWNTGSFKKEVFIHQPGNYNTNTYAASPNGDFLTAAIIYPFSYLKKMNVVGDSIGLFGGRASAPAYYGFATGEKSVITNFGGVTDMRDYLLDLTTAIVEHEAFTNDKKLSREERDKLVAEKIKTYPGHTTVIPAEALNGYNLLWNLELGGATVSKADSFSLKQQTISSDRNYTLINEVYDSDTKVANKNTYLKWIMPPLEGVSEAIANRIRNYYDTSSLFYKTVFADYRNSPVTRLINKIRKDTLSLIKIDSAEWIMALQNGYYMSSKNGAKVLSYVAGMNVYPFEQFDLKYNRPDKILQATGKADPHLIEAYYRAYLKRLKKSNIDTTQFNDNFELPEAEIINKNEIAYQQTQNNITIIIKVTDKNSSLYRYNIWINDVPIYGRTGKYIGNLKSSQFSNSENLILSTGINKITFSAININGTESYRIPLYVNYTPSVKQKESVRFIGIGIDQFKESQYNLQYSSKDIRDLAVKLKEKYKDNITIDTLFNENVTTEKVKALKEKLQQTSVNDKVIISYSGHGLLSKEYDYYLSTYAVNFSKPEENGLPYDELENLLDSIPARKKLLLIDACHSGEVDKEEGIAMNKLADSLGLSKGIIIEQTQKQQQVGLKNSFELMQSLFVNVGKSTGATVISAAAGNQFALERGDLKNGVFTYSLLEVMKKYPTIKISELKKIVGERVQQLTNGMQKPTSRNENTAVDWSLW